MAAAAAATAVPAIAAQCPLPARASGATSTSYAPMAMGIRLLRLQRPAAGGLATPRKLATAALRSSTQHVPAATAQQQQQEQHGSSWLSGGGPQVPLLRQRRQQLGGGGGGSTALRRRRLSSQQPGARPPRPQRAADIVRGLAADDDSEEGDDVAGVAVEAASSWGRYLVSPWDREIFLLAVPALFSVLLDPIMGMVSTAIIGSRLGTASLAAVGLCTIVFNFSNFIWNFLLYTTTPRIAAAASRKDTAAVSQITAQGLWMASVIGLTMFALLWTQCPAIFTAMGAKPEVVAPAVAYMRMRCLASPAILMYYVLSGTFRGFKDTKTPLYAGMFSNLLHLGLLVLLVFKLNLGVAGAGLATSLSHWVAITFLMTRVLSRGYMRVADLARPPAWSEVAPMLRQGLFLSTRSLLAMGMLMWATRLIAGFGAVGLAAHEILRQIWVFSNQAYTSLDIATQSLVAFHLGKGDRASAASVFRRTLSLAVFAGVGIMGALLAARGTLPGVFTSDAAVVHQVKLVLPLIAAFMPLDAAASVMDGVLLGSQEAGWLGKCMMATSVACAAGLLLCQRWTAPITIVWVVIKFLTVGRLIGNAYRLWSRHGPLGSELRGVPAHAA